ncbi:MAG TPA: hypothetical protein VL287_16085, partial [Gemmatimonadales bacterium]|nr:hypothetical protein [Gemmatimonadales bacterium]
GVEARGADDLLGSGLSGDQGTTGGQGLLEEPLETSRLVARFVGMLLPDEGIGSDGEKCVIVVRAQGAQGNEVAAKDRLVVKGHG